ncbi:MAG: DUF523 domain-containing protein [Anaerovorax sp.]
MYIISACLAGQNCTYNGENNTVEWVKEFMEEHKCILVCPESLGNLPTPRPPAEIVGDQVIDAEGKNVTEAFQFGAIQALAKMKKSEEILNSTVEMAILKANSPSCGCGYIYDGTFTGKRVKGDGVFAAMLRERNIQMITENDEQKVTDGGENDRF